MSNRKEYMKEYNKEYREKNREKLVEQKKEYYEKNRDKILKQNKEWVENNKDKIKERNKEYYEKNTEKLKEQKKEYRKIPENIKLCRIRDWKRYGVKCEDFDELYDYYIMSNNCEYCWKQVEGSNKHLDHLHSTGEVRGILCNGCNLKDVYAVKPCQKKDINIVYE